MLYILLFAALLAADQGLKLYVVRHLSLYESAPLLPGFVELKYIQNTGGGWSILSEHTYLLSLMTALIMAAVLVLLWRRIVRHPLGVLGCTLLLSGGMGNLIDRLRLGYVVDMFHFQFFPSYPVFNIADIAIVAGIILCAAYYLFFYDKYDARPKEAPHGTDHSSPRQ